MINLRKFWDNVSPEWRHIVNNLSDKKKSRLVNRATEYQFNLVDWEKINSAIDWGCGGGLLTKELMKLCKDTTALDITADSINQAKKYSKVKNTILLNDFTHSHYDLILCNAVVHHFPSVEYYNKIVDLWAKCSPKYILVQTKVGKSNREAKNYNRDFLDGLFLTKDYTIKSFDNKGFSLCGYKQVHSSLKKELGYFVFKSR